MERSQVQRVEETLDRGVEGAPHKVVGETLPRKVKGTLKAVEGMLEGVERTLRKGVEEAQRIREEGKMVLVRIARQRQVLIPLCNKDERGCWLCS